MFDKHHLLKHGTAIQGVVTSHKEIAHDQFGGELDYSIHVQVKFGDGTETQIVHRWTERSKVGSLRVGDKVPVRYDPDDHSKAVIDFPALEAAHAKQIADAKATLKRYEDERVRRAQGEIDAEAERGHKHHR
ncbi:DUF3592 domain-containing protein [Actinospica sp.]|jgi:hypothetical protein|uniref:DUF3592 domain-containing protein n=1 Tax=Actinospica sp. TaxID=1872142 RepID=UPI002C437B90|nr:DUF3592 domain-containing protein [Actinospica sp.]HWG27554.1 DUF3592 domain-containing protein [Actinospica sp.]